VIRLLADPRIRLGACVLAMAVIGGLGLVTHPKAPVTSPEAAVAPAPAVVNRTALSCPVVASGGKLSSVVNAVSPTLPEGTPTATGTDTPLSITPLAAKADPVGSLLVRGQIGSTPPATKPAPLSIQGTGPLAAGTVGTSTTTATEGVNEGMASVPCQLPGSDFWYVGASGASDRRDVLELTNLDSINAEVNVTMYARSGPQQDMSAARGIVVPARKTFELFLGQVATNLRDIALHVESTGGRVAPALRSNPTAGGKPAGVDWLNASAPPATKVFVPAAALGAGLRILAVANPSDLQATAGLTVHGPNGPFKPAGLETIQVPAGSVKTFRLDTVLHGDPSAITVTSDQPVTASMRMVDGSGKDFASLGSAEALTGPAYLVLPAHRQPAVLQVTAPGKSGSVKFELRDAAGRVLQTRALDVVGGATAPISFKAQVRATYLMVEQTRGTVVAGVTLMPAAKPADDDVAQVAAWPLNTSLVFRAQLGAQPDLRAALR